MSAWGLGLGWRGHDSDSIMDINSPNWVMTPLPKPVIIDI